MTKEEQEYIDNLIFNALTVQTDEIEGQQTININDLDMCSADYVPSRIYTEDDYDMKVLNEIYNDPNIIKLLNTSLNDLNLEEFLSDMTIESNVILEFADATITDPTPVYYQISIQPGETLNDDTVIGTIYQRGKMKTLKSIFSQGNVKGINENTDYFRLYPSNCSRHIVFENINSGNGKEYDLSEQLQDLNDKFTKEGNLFALITNCLPQSLLPYVLSRRYRGVYTRTFSIEYGYSKWFLDSSDLSVDNTEVSTYINNSKFKNNIQYDTPFIIYDIENENHDTGLKIFDASILNIMNDIQDEFGANIIGNDVTKADMKSWKKRAKKKKNRKKVKKEIKTKTKNTTEKIKHSENPYNAIEQEKDRLLNTRDKYINDIIELYKNKENLPLCKYDPEYNDCKFLVNNEIDGTVLKNVRNYDEDFTYTPIGDEDYYNYYFSLLGNLNLMAENEYVQKYYELITDIINKRLIIETADIKTLKRNFCKLFNDNIAQVFTFYQNEKYNTEEYINHLFTKFDNKINVFVQEQNTKHANDIRDEFTKMNLGEEAIKNAGTLYTTDQQYRQIHDYIKNIYSYNNDEDDEIPYETIAQLSTMYTFIKSYGNGENNTYKDLKTEDDKYIYYKLILEESKRICDFWDDMILEYENCKLNNCLDNLNEIANQFDEYAEWPTPTTLRINNVEYKHYLFTNLYERKEMPVDISVGEYDFPEEIPEFPKIPTDISVNEEEALEQMNKHEIMEVNEDPDIPTIKDTDYWKKYFTLATLICLVPTYWNCGLDIMPFIQNIPLPCIFIAIKSIDIPMFHMVIVFGIAIRGMYPWPIILYLNTSDQPISILTPLVATLDKLKTVFNQTINKIEWEPIEGIAEYYINKLNNEINDIKRENLKLDAYKRAIKSLKFPDGIKIGKEFELIAHPDVDTRQKITRLEQLARRSKAKHNQEE